MERDAVILLDTHTLVHYLMGERKIGRKTVARIDKALAAGHVFACTISFWEIAMLVARGRLELDTTVSAFRTLALQHGVAEEALDGEIAIAAAELQIATAIRAIA